MKLINREEAIWEKDKYVDHNNVHFIKNDEDINLEYIEYWNEHNCKTCLMIDNLCNQYYDNVDIDKNYKNDDLINKIRFYEINVYDLLRLREKFGSYMNEDEIKDIQHYLFNEYSDEDLESLKVIDPNINDVRTKTAVWCSQCGARKPDIIKEET